MVNMAVSAVRSDMQDLRIAGAVNRCPLAVVGFGAAVVELYLESGTLATAPKNVNLISIVVTIIQDIM